MRALSKDKDAFTAADAVIYPVLADNEKGAKSLEASCEDCKIVIQFDQDKEVVKALHQEVVLSKLGRMPAVIIVDKGGIIRYAYFGDSMSDIPPNHELLEVLNTINQQAPHA